MHLARVLGKGVISIELNYITSTLIEWRRRSDSIMTDTTASVAPDESVASPASSSNIKGKGRGKQAK